MTIVLPDELVQARAAAVRAIDQQAWTFATLDVERWRFASPLAAVYAGWKRSPEYAALAAERASQAAQRPNLRLPKRSHLPTKPPSRRARRKRKASKR